MTTLYCCSLIDKKPRYGSNDSNIIPVLAGASLVKDEIKRELSVQGWEMDDTGQNISKLNQIWGDLTVLYWAWRNSTKESWGVCQYRRKWSECDVINSRSDVLYVPYPVKLFEGSVKRQYEWCHGMFPAYEISIRLARSKKIPLTIEMLDAAWNQDLLYSCNMARGPKNLMDIFCELAFATMEAFYADSMDICLQLQGYQRRSIAFTAERMITAIMLHSEFFFGTNKVRCASMELIQ